MLHIGRPTRVLFSGRVACRSTSTRGKGRGPPHQPYPIASFYHARTHGERSPPLPRADARRVLPASGGHGSRARCAAAPAAGGQASRLDAPPLLTPAADDAAAAPRCERWEGASRGGSQAASDGRARPRFPRLEDGQARRPGGRRSCNLEHELPRLARSTTD
jgi:hypothetical protein